jgi:hypothetical protein
VGYVKTLEELIGPLPAGIAALPQQDRTELTLIYLQARRTQGRELEQAAYSLLDLLPGFLRGAVRKAAGA